MIVNIVHSKMRRVKRGLFAPTPCRRLFVQAVVPLEGMMIAAVNRYPAGVEHAPIIRLGGMLVRGVTVRQTRADRITDPLRKLKVLNNTLNV